MFSFKQLIEEAKKSGCTCWTGYKRVPGTKPCSADSCIKESQRGLWDNIHAKQKRIKAGSGEKMRKPGSKGAPTAAALKASQTNEETELDEGYDKSSEHHKNARKMAKDYDGKATFHPNGHAEVRMRSIVHGHSTVNPQGTTLMSGEDLAKRASKEYGKGKVQGNVVHFKEEVEAQFDLIESVVNELALLHNIDPEVLWEKFEQFTDQELLEYAVDAKRHKSSTGGLTQKGRDAYNAKGANLQAPVTTPPSKLKAGSKAANRRKSFCARMGGMEGAMEKPNGEPTRKALALRKWNC